MTAIMISLKIMMMMTSLLSITIIPVYSRKHSPHTDEESLPTYEDLGDAVAAGLISLARTAHHPIARLGIDIPLDPLRSSSELKYVHEGDLLHLKLVLDNVTLVGFKSLTVQEVTFKRPPDDFTMRDPSWSSGDDMEDHNNNYRGEEEEEEEEAEQEEDFDYSDPWQHGDLYQYEDWSRLTMQPSPLTGDGKYQEGGGGRGGAGGGRGGAGGRGGGDRDRHTHGPEGPSSSEGTIRVAFKQMAVKAKYLVRGSAGGFFTFRETGDLTLTSPTVFLTTRLNVTLPGFGYHRHQTAVPSRHGRVKVLWARSNVSIGTTSLLLKPGVHPPEWVRQQVQSKLEELSSDLSHGHGAVRLLLRRWGRLVKRLIHRTARNLTK